jgi:hypothetical protein
MFKYTLKYWLPLAAAITLICATIYVAVQQDLRMGLNDPQIQMAEDAARALAAGQAPAVLIPPSAYQIDISLSLAPYLAIYDPQGKLLVASNASLNGGGSLPVPPTGVFEYTRQHKEDRLSWQPEPGVRSAIVVVAVNGGQGGFVLAGRGMREVENRESALTTQVGAGWAASLIASLILVAFFEILPFTRARS